jgi:anti-sigma B factor antagonist
MRGWQDIHVKVASSGSESTVVVHGQVDLATVSRLREPLARTVRDAHVSHVTVGLHGCSYLDSSGVKALLGEAAEATRRRKRVVVANATGIVRQLLQFACAGEQVELLDDGAGRVRPVAAPRGLRELDRVELSMVRAADSIGALRSAVTEVLRRTNLDNQLLDRARLVIGELVTNSVEHGAGAPRLAFEYADPMLRLEVRDDAEAFDPAGAGLGLRVVEHFSDAWGVSTDGNGGEGKVVWAQLAKGS